MGEHPSSLEPGSVRPSISAGKAVILGHLLVNLPVVILILGSTIIGLALVPNVALLFLVLGFVTAWIWWSYTVPRWRRWALRRGANPDRLQKLAAATGLVWPKGWVFEKTEFKVDDEAR